MNNYTPKLNQYYIRICDDVCTLKVHWLRTTMAENENLLTTRTKHHFYELHYILEGEITLKVSEQDIILRKDQFILITPEHYHEITAYSPNTKKLVFGFDAELTDKQLNQKLKEASCTIHEETNCLRKLAELLILLPEEQPLDLSRNLSNIISIQLRCLTEAFLFTLLPLLITEDAASAIPDSVTKNSYKQDLIDKMISYIRSSTVTGGGFVTVDDITELFHISKRHLNRICVEITGKTTRKILDEERLRYIRDLLSTTGYTLHDISFLTGFASEQSLVRFFHQREGYTPTQYRKYILK